MSQRRPAATRALKAAAAALALAALLALPAFGEVLGVYFGPRQAIDAPLIERYDEARVSIHVAMFALTLEPYADALVRAHRRGVEVRVVLDRRQARHPASRGGGLEAAGVPVRYAGGGGLMHHKFSIVDGRLLATGSYNATWSGTHRNSENALIIDDPKAVELYEEEFRRLWEGHPPDGQPPGK